MPSIIAGSLPIPGAGRTVHRALDMVGGGQWNGSGNRTVAINRGGDRSAGGEGLSRKTGGGAGDTIGFYRGLIVNRFPPDVRYTLENMLLSQQYERPQAGALLNDSRRLTVYDCYVAFSAAGLAGAPTIDCGVHFVQWDGALVNALQVRDGDARSAQTTRGFGVSLRHTGAIAFVHNTADQVWGGFNGFAFEIVDLAQHGVLWNGNVLDVTKFMRWRFEFRQPTATTDGTMRFFLNGALAITRPMRTKTNYTSLAEIGEPKTDQHMVYLPMVGSYVGAGVTMYAAEVEYWSGPDMAGL